MGKIFSKEELIEIQNDASVNLEYYLDTVVVDGESNERTISTISKNNHLIFVKGNTDTGFKHLNDRHSFFSFKNYWIESSKHVFKLDNPSKFHPKMTPIIDYVKIADAIFSSENKNITNNHSPHMFDKYTGIYLFEDGQEGKYHLITYKDTKIVHTLFPDKKKHNRKIRFKYGKGFVSTKLNISPPYGYNDLLIPYENKDKITVYSILIRKFYNEKIERLMIQKHDANGNSEMQFILGHRNFEDFESFNRETANYYQTADLAELEDIISQIEKNETL